MKLPIRSVVGAGLVAVCALAAGSLATAAPPTPTTPTATTPTPTTPTPSSTGAPTISGKPQEGQILRASPGRLRREKGATLSYQWLRCDTNGGSCSPIQNATDRIYTAFSTDIGRTLIVAVTATAQQGPNIEGRSQPTGQIAPAAPRAPRLASLPSIAGNAQRGEVLTVRPETWTGPPPISFSYSWRLCDAAGGN